MVKKVVVFIDCYHNSESVHVHSRSLLLKTAEIGSFCYTNFWLSLLHFVRLENVASARDHFYRFQREPGTARTAGSFGVLSRDRRRKQLVECKVIL